MRWRKEISTCLQEIVCGDKMIYYEDKKYHFFELFNEKSGTLIRSNVFGTDLEATMRSFPELIDIGIKS